MNPEMHKGGGRTLENKLEEANEKLDMFNLLSEKGFSSVEDLPVDIMDRLKEIALLEGLDNIDTVKELLVTELQIFKLNKLGMSEDELTEEIEESLTKVAKILLSDTAHSSNEEEAHLVLRSALKKSPTGLRFTDALLEAVQERKAVRQNI
jgi:hypothetical protein